MNPNFKSITFNLEELELLNKIISEYRLDLLKNRRERFYYSKLLFKVLTKKTELEVQKSELEKNAERS